jgi:hypothetical protein
MQLRYTGDPERWDADLERFRSTLRVEMADPTNRTIRVKGSANDLGRVVDELQHRWKVIADGNPSGAQFSVPVVDSPVAQGLVSRLPLHRRVASWILQSWSLTLSIAVAVILAGSTIIFGVSWYSEVTAARTRAAEGRSRAAEGRSRAAEGRSRAAEGKSVAEDLMRRSASLLERVLESEDRPRAAEDKYRVAEELTRKSVSLLLRALESEDAPTRRDAASILSEFSTHEDVGRHVVPSLRYMWRRSPNSEVRKLCGDLLKLFDPSEAKQNNKP